MGLRLTVQSFFVFLGTLMMLSTLGACAGLAVGSAANDFQEAQASVAPFIIPLIIFAGYLLPYDNIPFYFRWLYYCSFIQYAMSCLLINEWQHVDFVDCPAEGLGCFQDGPEYLASMHVYPKDRSFDYYMLAVYVVVVIVLGYYKTKLSMTF